MNRIFISIFAASIYRNSIDFCILTLHSMNFLNSFIGGRGEQGKNRESLGEGEKCYSILRHLLHIGMGSGRSLNHGLLSSLFYNEVGV